MHEFPLMLYHEDGRTQVVGSRDEEAKMGDGWSRDQGDIHRSGSAVRPTSHVTPVTQSGRDEFVEAVIRRMREEFFTDPALIKRGPGRPPNATRPIVAEQAASRDNEPKE